MPDPTNIPSLNPLVDKNDLDALREAVNIQLEIENSMKRQNNNLFEQLGIRKDLSINLIQYFKKVKEISDLTKESKLQEASLAKLFNTIQDETKKRQLEQIINSIKQRRESYEKELEMLHKLKASGFLPLVWLISKSYMLFKKMDAAAFEFRKEIGMIRKDAEYFRKTAESIAIEFMHIGVNINGAYESIIALGNEMGSIRTITKELIKTTSILKAQLGVASDDSAAFFKNMASVSNSTMQLQENMAYVVADLSRAAGVALPLVMKDLATKSSTTLTMMSRLPNQIIRSTVELRKMGTSLDQAAKSSRELLNFSDNIVSEMEASVLLGRAINLQRARELAYRRDLEGSTKEILRITQQIDFASLDVFQQEAFAKATGKSVDELLKLVQAEKQWKLARSSPELAGQVKAYEQLRASNQSIAKASAENLRFIIEQQSNQERLNAITQKWNQIVARASSFFLPIIDVVLALAIPLMDIGQGIAGWSLAIKSASSVLGQFAGITETVSSVVTTLSKYGSFGISLISKAFPIFGKISAMVGKLIGFIKPLIGFISPLFKFAAPFIKAVPVIGWIITGFQFIVSLIQRFKEFSGKDNVIVAGLKAIGYALYDVLVKPFMDAWDWISSIWSGKSPSVLGLSIVKGISAIGPMLFDAITSPWRLGLAWILKKIPGMSSISDKLSEGMSGILKKPLESRIGVNTPSVITPSNIGVAGEVSNSPIVVKSVPEKDNTESSNEILINILNSINTLNKNLENGKIGFYVDSQLLSATIARQTEFRNGFGVNKARV